MARTAAAARPVQRRAQKTANINLRVSSQVRDLIDTAADAMGKTRTEFVIESAKQHATDVLLDQRLFQLDGKQAAHFLNVLKNPPEPNEKLRAVLNRRPPWET